MITRRDEFTEGPIASVEVRPLRKHSDQRGWLVEIYRIDELEARIRPVMAYISETLPGVTRGPHEHTEQGDYFCFLSSTFELILWDNRSQSPTFWHKQRIVAGEDNPCVVVVPEGVVHAYRNIGEKAGWVINCANRLYAGPGRQDPVDEIRHESDPNSPFRVTP